MQTLEPQKITWLKTGRSRSEPLIQLADLSAGMGVYSYARFDSLQAWDGFEGDVHTEFKKKEQFRNCVIGSFHNTCLHYDIDLALDETSGFHTQAPNCPFGFRLFIGPAPGLSCPESEFTAPTRAKPRPIPPEFVNVPKPVDWSEWDFDDEDLDDW